MKPPRMLLTALLLCGASLTSAQPPVATPTPRAGPATPSPGPRISPSPMGRPSPGQMRFRGMDRDNDGKISREEWRGNDKSFANKDRNGDGVLSGDEVRPPATGEAGASGPRPSPSTTPSPPPPAPSYRPAG